MSGAYYNEIDEYAAQWLRNLIAAGLIAPGVVDTRSIVDVRPDDLKEFTQCHFFAGIGGWSAAFRLAGWSDSRRVWSASCPCQPFSDAGAGAGFTDERHLWPHVDYLITQCRPDVVFGEQVASKDALEWLDLVQADMEGKGYAFAAVDSCAAGFGAPHIRQRLYWVADDMRERSDGRRQSDGSIISRIGATAPQWEQDTAATQGRGTPSGLAYPGDQRRDRVNPRLCRGESRQDRTETDWRREAVQRGRFLSARELAEIPYEGRFVDPNRNPGPVNGFWAAADWLLCRDGKWRPVESFFQSLANGVSCGMGRLRPDQLQALETEIINYAKTFQRDAAKDLRDLWEAIPSTIFIERETGRFDGILPEEVLFAFLCQLSSQRWHFAQGIARAGEETSWANLRMLWRNLATSSAPRGRGLEEQRFKQSANPLHLLSRILARHAYSAWGDGLQANAVARSPLMQGAPNRVGRLRAYGNAIVPPQAAEIIRAFMEYRP